MNQTAVKTQGVHHVGLTVPDLAASKAFFESALGFNQVGEKADYPAVFLSDGSVMLTLWQARNPQTAVAFDRQHNIGLHHLALRVEDDQALDDLHLDLGSRADVAVEFPPEPLSGLPVRHMMCEIPGGIRVEFIAA